MVPWIVQYRVKDPFNYLYKVNHVRKTFRDLAEASMRLVVGDSSINEVISKREEIAGKDKVLLQKFLDEAETGIKVVNVEMKKTNVPEPVQPSLQRSEPGRPGEGAHDLPGQGSLQQGDSGGKGKC